VDPDLGITCPRCQARHRFRVIDSRPTRTGVIRRRRKCQDCGKIVITLEMLHGQAIQEQKRRAA
jgi:transcriptional regulator NrdR family protein